MKKKVVFVCALLAVVVSALGVSAAHAQSTEVIQSSAPNKKDYVLLVEVKVKVETVLKFKEALLSIVARTRAETGNLAYIVHQSPDDATDFIVYEHWQSDGDHLRHLKSPGFLNYSKIIAPMMEAGFPVRKKMIELDSTVNNKN